MENLIDGIALDTYKIIVPYCSSMQNTILMLSEIPSFSISGHKLSVNSELFDINITFRIIFSFKSESMENVSIIPLQSKENPQKLYRKVQQKLASILGPATNIPGVFLNLFNSDFKNNSWKFKNIKVSHLLWEHFGFREKVSIDINNT